MMTGDIICSWGRNRNELGICGNTEYVLGYICDKCGDTGIVDLCPVHLNMWENKYTTLHCKQCQGTLSWEARNIFDGTSKCRFNKSSL